MLNETNETEPEDLLVRMTVALERCAGALETLVGKPAWVKAAENRLGQVNEIRETAVELSSVQETTNEPEPAPKVETVEEPKEAPSAEPSTPPSGIDVGMRVRVVVPDDPRKDGLTGTIVKRTNAWAQLQTEDGVVPVRPKDCVVLEGEDENPPAELVTEVVEEPVFEPSDDASAAENFTIAGGVHDGKTLHVLYNESPSGKAFVVWLAKNGVKGPETTTAAQDYLKSIGQGWE